MKYTETKPEPTPAGRQHPRDPSAAIRGGQTSFPWIFISMEQGTFESIELSINVHCMSPQVESLCWEKHTNSYVGLSVQLSSMWSKFSLGWSEDMVHWPECHPESLWERQKIELTTLRQATPSALPFCTNVSAIDLSSSGWQCDPMSRIPVAAQDTVAFVYPWSARYLNSLM